MKIIATAAAAAAMFGASAAMAAPAVMVQAKDAVILAGGPGFGTLLETYNQAGLAAGYVDEVTPLHPYAAVTSHNLVFAGNEWFGEQGTLSASVSYFVDASATVNGINHFVLWNEDAAGIGIFDLYYGAFAGDLADLVLAGITPTDNPVADYFADVYEFSARPNSGWWTLVMDGCPQPDGTGFQGCAIGEVAWGGGVVPEPATWGMMIAGFGLVGLVARRRRLDRRVTA